MNTPFAEFAKEYSKRLAAAVDELPLDAVEALDEMWLHRHRVARLRKDLKQLVV